MEQEQKPKFPLRSKISYLSKLNLVTNIKLVNDEPVYTLESQDGDSLTISESELCGVKPKFEVNDTVCHIATERSCTVISSYWHSVSNTFQYTLSCDAGIMSNINENALTEEVSKFKVGDLVIVPNYPKDTVFLIRSITAIGSYILYNFFYAAGELGLEHSGEGLTLANDATAPTPVVENSPRQRLFGLHEKLTSESFKIMESKNHDYAGKGSVDPYFNFRRCELVGLCSVETGIMVRLMDKFSRLITFVKDGELKVTDEKLDDTVMDVINYLVILSAFNKEKVNDRK